MADAGFTITVPAADFERVATAIRRMKPEQVTLFARSPGDFDEGSAR